MHHHKLLLIVLSTTTPCTFRTINCEAPEHGLSTLSRPLPFEATSHENVSIIASVRGLVCVRIIKERKYSDLILWNPLTGEYKTLSRPNNEECYIKDATIFGFYYSCNDYKLLLVTRRHDVYIYSLKSDSWRKVETTQEDFKILSSPFLVWNCWEQPCVLLNEKLYFLIQRVKRKLVTISYSIIRFDSKTEKLRKIATPSFGPDPDQSKTWTWCLSFSVVRGCIHLYVICRNTNVNSKVHYAIEAWRMEIDGDWTKMVTYNPPSFPWFYGVKSMLHFMKNGNWLMHYQSGIYKVNIEKNIEEELFSYKTHMNGIIIHPGGKYMETLGINLFNMHQKPCSLVI